MRKKFDQPGLQETPSHPACKEHKKLMMGRISTLLKTYMFSVKLSNGERQFKYTFVCFIENDDVAYFCETPVSRFNLTLKSCVSASSEYQTSPSFPKRLPISPSSLFQLPKAYISNVQTWNHGTILREQTSLRSCSSARLRLWSCSAHICILTSFHITESRPNHWDCTR